MAGVVSGNYCFKCVSINMFSISHIVPDSRILVSWYPRYRDFEGQRQVLQRFFRGLEKNSSVFNQGAMFDSKILLNLKFLITKCPFFSKYK